MSLDPITNKVRVIVSTGAVWNSAFVYLKPAPNL
jgi:hypothetical protein